MLTRWFQRLAGWLGRRDRLTPIQHFPRGHCPACGKDVAVSRTGVWPHLSADGTKKCYGYTVIPASIPKEVPGASSPDVETPGR